MCVGKDEGLVINVHDAMLREQSDMQNHLNSIQNKHWKNLERKYIKTPMVVPVDAGVTENSYFLLCTSIFFPWAWMPQLVFYNQEKY